MCIYCDQSVTDSGRMLLVIFAPKKRYLYVHTRGEEGSRHLKFAISEIVDASALQLLLCPKFLWIGALEYKERYRFR